jgi:toxin secretion/phage lysis holin
VNNSPFLLKRGDKMDALKAFILTVIGVIGGFVTTLFGGWSAALTTLIIAMAIDYLSGIIVAGVFNKSIKSETGALESKAGWKGLFRKGMTLLIVLIAYRLDLAVGTTFIKDAVIIAYIANEVISITENAGLMGVPIPKPILKGIDILKQKSEEDTGNDK